MSNLPPAARKQVREANAMIEAQKKGTAPPPVALTPVPGAQATLQPVPNFASVGAPVPPDAVPVAPAAPAPAPAPVEPPADATAMPATDTADHRYRVLQGKYTAETRRAAARIAQLEETVSNLAARPQAAPAAPVAPTAPQTTEDRALALGITKAELAEYGPELVELVMRVSAGITAPEIRRLAAEQQRLSGAVTQSVQVAQRTAREMVYEALGSAIPTWEVVNNSQEFLDWLGESDIFSGQTRNASLMRAFENNDATRVVGIFKAYLAEDERTRSTARTPRVDPATLLAPGTPGGGTPAPKGDAQEGRIWLESEVRDFYSLVRSRRISKADAQAMEAEINLALIQGRIKPEHNDQNLTNAR